MKHLKIALIAFITLGTVSLAQAQSKVAHISTQELIEAMPSYQQYKSEMSKLKNTYQAQMEDMYKSLEEKSKKYQSEAEGKSKAENQTRMQELTEARQRIMQFQQNAQKKLAQKQKELIEPIIEKARKAIQTVADNLGYDYVLDSSPSGGVLVANGNDLMDEVKAELGL